MIRVGIGTYGIWPSRETQLASRERGRRISLTPALSWKTRIAQIKSDQARGVRRLWSHLPGKPSDEDCHPAHWLLRRL